MNDYKQIRQRYLNGESQRSIAKSMGISRNTVKKYCEGENVPWERKTPERDEYSRACFLQVQIPEICRQKWRILHLRFGESCRLPGRIT